MKLQEGFKIDLNRFKIETTKDRTAGKTFALHAQNRVQFLVPQIVT